MKALLNFGGQQLTAPVDEDERSLFPLSVRTLLLRFFSKSLSRGPNSTGSEGDGGRNEYRSPNPVLLRDSVGRVDVLFVDARDGLDTADPWGRPIMGGVDAAGDGGSVVRNFQRY